MLKIVTLRWLLWTLLLLLLAGCGGADLAPVEGLEPEANPPLSTGTAPLPSSRPHRPRSSDAYGRRAQATMGTHIVGTGETLHSVARRYNMDAATLARINHLTLTFKLYRGQRLLLRESGGPPMYHRPVRPYSPAYRYSSPVTPAYPYSDEPQEASYLHWQWPTEGSMFHPDTEKGKQGVDILGREGQPIRAAAAGEVVYCGEGLRGYGKLVIIKHDNIYLSAYAHNRRVLVAEGARVAAGQQIAEMGSTGTQRVKLHFEIRRNGKPVPPLRFLPRRNI
jgi:lipoprotein NlpD